MGKMLDDYNTLINLLRSQRRALAAEDSQKCSALLPLITKYRQRIQEHQARHTSLTDREIALLNPIIATLHKEVESCRERWMERRKSLEEARRELQSTRRLVKHLEHPRKTSARIVNWTA